MWHRRGWPYANDRRNSVVVIVIVAVAMTIVVVIAIVPVIAVMIVIPFMAVFDAAMWTFPIAVIELPSIVARADPASAFIWWPAPVTFVPAIVACNGIPVTADPHEFGRGLRRNDGDDAGFGRRTNTDSDRYLRTSGDTDQQHGRQQNRRQQSGPDEISHKVISLLKQI